MKKILFTSILAAAAGALAGPFVSDVAMSQADDRIVTVTYKLSGAPAIVTLDITTNGVSIGEANVYRLCPPSGDVSKLMRTNGTYTITWRADRAWPDHRVAAAVARPVVTAWAPSDPPDYLVADLTSVSNVCYYTSVDALPGGLLGNEAYRTTKMVLRRIHAKNVSWTMGSIGEKNRKTNEKPHAVTMTNDYYIAVFPVTQCQYAAVTADRARFEFKNEGFWAKRIAENLTYHHVRCGSGTAAECHYPAPPHATSYLGMLRAKTGVLFDLPGEAQWEFAARAGHGEATWGDGRTFAVSANDIGRVQVYPSGTADSAAIKAAAATCDDTAGTPTAGSYPPNDFGLYDMAGGVSEFCLDWYQEDISNLTAGEINANGALRLDGTAGENRVKRGGAWYRPAEYARPARRDGVGANDSGVAAGASFRSVRLAAPIPAAY